MYESQTLWECRRISRLRVADFAYFTGYSKQLKNSYPEKEIGSLEGMNVRGVYCYKTTQCCAFLYAKSNYFLNTTFSHKHFYNTTSPANNTL